MKLVAWGLFALVLVMGVNGLAQLRTVRRLAAVPVAPVAQAAETVTSDGEKVEMVMAELVSEADSVTEDGSNDSSAAADASDADSESESIHAHYRQFTKPMELLPNDHTTLVEVAAREEEEEEGGEGKGSNPTYILPVDPFNYFPFFNGFSNVNPFSQFYPPAPYLYPQYTNYMHQYANHGAGHAPGYPVPGSYGGVGYAGAAHTGFPNNYGAPAPHMHYPFGAYKMDVSGPDVRTGSNNPPPFPQFTETGAKIKLISPEIIPKSELAAAQAEEDGEEEGDTVIAALIETGSEDESEAEVEMEAEEEGEESEDVEILDESQDNELTSEGVEFETEADTEAEDMEYVQ